MILKEDLLFVIKNLKNKIKSWYKGQWIDFVLAGESLKSVENFYKHSKRISKKISKPNLFFQNKNNLKKSFSSPSCFVGIGGGSVTDFTGFFSSIYKRGRPVFYIPTTMLCALDAAHGGKTGLNFMRVKNHFGSYHFPKGVFIVKDFIQPAKKQKWICDISELIKIALIQGGFLYEQIRKKIPPRFESIWPFIPWAVEAKLNIVEKDPFEKNSQRVWLNFGHTFGHCVEAYHGFSHGRSVAVGMAFAICWSVKKKFLSKEKAREWLDILSHYTGTVACPSIPASRLKTLLCADKKAIGKGINFIFIRGAGRPISRTVSIDNIVSFYKEMKGTSSFSHFLNK